MGFGGTRVSNLVVGGTAFHNKITASIPIGMRLPAKKANTFVIKHSDSVMNRCQVTTKDLDEREYCFDIIEEALLTQEPVKSLRAN